MADELVTLEERGSVESWTCPDCGFSIEASSPQMLPAAIAFHESAAHEIGDGEWQSQLPRDV